MTVAYSVVQSTTAIIPWPCDFTNSLLSGATVSSAVATHTPPSGAATNPTEQVTSPIVYVSTGPLTVTGIHYVDVVATFSDGHIDDIRLVIRVDY